VFVFSIFFYPLFIFVVIYTNKYPNNRFSKWWKKHIIDKNENYD
jgi:hypothetical protein